MQLALGVGEIRAGAAALGEFDEGRQEASSVLPPPVGAISSAHLPCRASAMRAS